MLISNPSPNVSHSCGVQGSSHERDILVIGLNCVCEMTNIKNKIPTHGITEKKLEFDLSIECNFVHRHKNPVATSLNWNFYFLSKPVPIPKNEMTKKTNNNHTQ